MDTVFIHIAHLRLWEETAASEKQFWVKVRALCGQVGVRARLLGSLPYRRPVLLGTCHSEVPEVWTVFRQFSEMGTGPALALALMGTLKHLLLVRIVRLLVQLGIPWHTHQLIVCMPPPFVWLLASFGRACGLGVPMGQGSTEKPSM